MRKETSAVTTRSHEYSVFRAMNSSLTFRLTLRSRSTFNVQCCRSTATDICNAVALLVSWGVTISSRFATCHISSSFVRYKFSVGQFQGQFYG